MVATSWYWHVTFFVLVAGARALNGQELPISPCPKLFYYSMDSETSEIFGALHIPPPNSHRITISIELVVDTNLKRVRRKYNLSQS
jgi:hypothetical protein